MSDYKNVKTMSDAKAGDFRQVNYYFLRKAEEEIADLKASLKEVAEDRDLTLKAKFRAEERLTAERTKSAKLAKLLKMIFGIVEDFKQELKLSPRWCEQDKRWCIKAKKALAEYKEEK